jgi:outer membrane protein insertion porin family/translocation and assembly module TamA
VLTTALAACKSVPESRVGVSAIHFHGNGEISGSDLEDRIATQETPKFLYFFRASWQRYEDFAPEVLQKDLERIQRHYQRRGYYGTEVRAGRVVPQGKFVYVEILIHQGDPVHVHSITVNGVDSEPRRVQRRATQGVTMEIGDIFDEDKLELSTKGIASELANLGYAYGKVNPRVVIDLGPRTAELTFQVDPGIPCKVGPLTFEGLGALPEDIVRRSFSVQQGEDYAADELEVGRKTLVDLGVFASVDVLPDLSDPNRAEVPIKVSVTRSSLRGFRLGGGLQIDYTRADVHGLVGWEHRNLFGGMRHFTVEERPSVVFFPTAIGSFRVPNRLLPANSLAATLTQPSFPESRTTSSVHLEFNNYPVILPPVNVGQDIFPGYHEVRGSIGPERDFPFIKLRASVLYNYQANFPFTYAGHINSAFGPVTASYIDLRAVFDLRDDPVQTKQGFLLESSLQFAGGVLGGSADDIRFRPAMRMFFPVIGNVILAARGVLGFVYARSYGGTLAQPFEEVADLATANTYLRDRQLTYFRGFFSGGADSNRGYGFRAIGPFGVNPFLVPAAFANAGNQDQLGVVKAACAADPTANTNQCPQTASGGLSLWEASLEFRIPIEGPLGTVVFADASDVSPYQSDIRLNVPHLSVGFGIRYATPVGPVRLDLGFRITHTPSNGSAENVAIYGVPPKDLFGILPAALAIGLGEAY